MTTLKRAGNFALQKLKECIMRKILSFILLSITINTMAQNLQSAGYVLTDETCDMLCKAAQTKSREMGLDISFAIADSNGLPRLFRRFGNALVLSATLVPTKPIHQP